MTTTYSTYEAKMRFSEVIRRVRKGHHIRITHHGKEVAEIVPVSDVERGLEGRLEELEERGLISRRRHQGGDWDALTHSPGALAQFLEERE